MPGGLAASNRAIEALAMMFRGASLTQAAHDANVAPSTILRLHSGALERYGRRWVVDPEYALGSGGQWIRVTTVEGARLLPVPSEVDRSTIGRYHDAVRDYLHNGDTSGLKELGKVRVTDAGGHRVELETDPSRLRELAEAGELSFDDIYQE